MLKKLSLFFIFLSNFQAIVPADYGRPAVRVLCNQQVDAAIAHLDGMRSFFQQARARVQEVSAINEIQQLDDRYAVLNLDRIKDDLKRELSESLAECITNLAGIQEVFAQPTFATPEIALLASELEMLRESFDPLTQMNLLGDFAGLAGRLDVINSRFISWWWRLKALGAFSLPAGCQASSSLQQEELQLALRTRNESAWQQYLATIRAQVRVNERHENGECLSDYMSRRVESDDSLLLLPSEFRAESAFGGVVRKINAYRLLGCSKVCQFSGSKLINFSDVIRRYSLREVEQIITTILAPPIRVPAAVSSATSIFERIVRDSIGEPGARREVARTILEWAVHFNFITELAVTTIQDDLRANPNMSYAEWLRLIEEFIRDGEFEWFIDNILLPSLKWLKRGIFCCGWNGITAAVQNFVGTKLVSMAGSMSDRAKQLRAEDGAFDALQKHRNCKMLLLLSGIRQTERYYNIPEVRSVNTILDAYVERQQLNAQQLIEAQEVDPLHDLAVDAAQESLFSISINFVSRAASSVINGLLSMQLPEGDDADDYGYLIGSMAFQD
jgi:hypothetical protein